MTHFLAEEEIRGASREIHNCGNYSTTEAKIRGLVNAQSHIARALQILLETKETEQ